MKKRMAALFLAAVTAAAMTACGGGDSSTVGSAEKSGEDAFRQGRV